RTRVTSSTDHVGRNDCASRARHRPGMPRTANRPTQDLPPVFLGRDAVAEGVLTINQLRGPLVERVVQGVYRPSWVPLTHTLACQAVALVLPDVACVTGLSAATVRGVPLLRATDP